MAAMDRTPRPSIVATLAAELLADPEPILEELLDAIAAAEAPYREGVADEFEQSVRDNLVSVLTDLARERGVTAAFPRRTARRRAEEGVPLESVLHAFGLGFRTIWQHMVAQVLSRDPDALPELLRGGTVVWDAIDAYATAAAKAYRERVGQLMRHATQQRMAHVSAVLEGRLSDWTVRSEAATALDLDPNGRFVVVVADASGTVRTLPELEDHLARRHVASAWTPRPDGVAGIVAITRHRPLEQVIDLLVAVADGRVGMSPPVDGLAHVVDAVPLAAVARNSLPHGRHGLATFDQRPVAAIVAGSPRIVTIRVVETVLGGILALDGDEQEVLLETLQAWFDHGGSTTATAGAVFCHRNTVRNRLNRVLEVTGRDVNDPRHVSELHTALLAHQLGVATPSGDQAPNT